MRKLKRGNHYKIGDILRTKSGFTFIVEQFYKFSIFEQVFCSGRGIGSNKPYDFKDVGIIVGVNEEECTLVKSYK